MKTFRDRWNGWGSRLIEFVTKFDFVLTKSWWKTWYHHPDLENPGEDDAHQEAENWVLGYTPVASANEEAYSSALKYAERLYDSVVKTNEALDKKLDDLWRNASTVGTILAATAKFFPISSSFLSSLLIVAALIFLALTVILAAYTRGSASMAFPTPIRSILDVIESDPPPRKADIEAVEAASYHFATMGMTRINLWKSKQSRRATTLFCLGLVLLILALLSAGPQSTTLSHP